MGTIVGTVAVGLALAAGASIRVPDVVEARRFVVRDSRGNIRGDLNLNRVEGTETLRFIDPGNRPRVELGTILGLETVSFFLLTHAEMTGVLSNMADSHGTTVQLQGKVAPNQLMIGFRRGKETGEFAIYDHNHSLSLVLATGPITGTLLQLKDIRDHVRVKWGLIANGKLILHLMDEAKNFYLKMSD